MREYEEQCALIWSVGLTLMTMIVSSTDTNYVCGQSDFDDVEYECLLMAYSRMNIDILMNNDILNWTMDKPMNI